MMIFIADLCARLGLFFIWLYVVSNGLDGRLILLIITASSGHGVFELVAFQVTSCSLHKLIQNGGSAHGRQNRSTHSGFSERVLVRVAQWRLYAGALSDTYCQKRGIVALVIFSPAGFFISCFI